ncbi:MAG TPA: hypothetical protein VIM51_05405 [Desulfosporosinus sp.]
MSIKNNEEIDSSREIWKYYKEIYTEKHWPLIKEFDLENVLTYEERNSKRPKEIKRYYSYIKQESSNKEKFGFEFSLGGECDFNFNEEKKRQFKELLQVNSSTKELEEQLEKCCSMHHDKLNFSVVPTTGKMNNFKGTVYFDGSEIKCENSTRWHKSAYDRLDTFVYCLNEFFINKNELVLSLSTQCNKSCLQEYLNTFSNDIYNYCRDIYFIKNRNFVKRLIENGRKPINNSVDLKQYMDLAIEYWKIKESHINSNLSE